MTGGFGRDDISGCKGETGRVDGSRTDKSGHAADLAVAISLTLQHANSVRRRVLPSAEFFFTLIIIMISVANCVPSIRYASEQSPGGGQAVSNRQAGAATVPPRGGDSGKQAPPRKSAKNDSQKLLEEVVASYIGSPYRYGGTDRNGFDCSGFTITVYREVYGADLPRTSSDMWTAGRQVPVTAARPGDLVFFKGNNFGAIGHVGIFMGGRRFAHSAASSGVIYSDLDETYYSRRFVGVRRMR